MQKKNLLTFFLAILSISCNKVIDNGQERNFTNHFFSNQGYQEIYNLVDARKTDSLTAYFFSDDQIAQKVAINGMASVQDSAAIPELQEVLKGDFPSELKVSAAFALGQTGNNKAENSLKKALAIENNPEIQIKILEALGKCANESTPDYLAMLSLSNDSLKYGQALGLYRAGVKGYHSSFTKEKIAEFLHPNVWVKTRIIAANYLSRFGDESFSEYATQIANSARFDSAAYVRMNTIIALQNFEDSHSMETIKNGIASDPDYRVRLNAIRAADKLDYNFINEEIWKALDDENVNVGIVAAEYFSKKGIKADLRKYIDRAKVEKNWRIRSILIGTVFNMASLKEMDDFVYHYYSQIENNYEKAAIVQAMGKGFHHFSFLQNQLYNEKIAPVIRTAAIEAMLAFRKGAHYGKAVKFKGSIPEDFKKSLKYAIESKDISLVYYAAQAFRDEALNLKESYDNLDFLYETRDNLNLPLDIEAWLELEKTINYIEGKGAIASLPKTSKSEIDWLEVASIKKNQKVKVETNKGEIEFKLFVEKTPGTTSLYTSLIKEGFFDGKTFHRVAPNFVVQGGCPRGDGFGGLPQTIRSEFADTYYDDEGYVGVASAGKDTESCQFFITHSPTPHLDGRYTIFGKVTNGMEVVHQLEIGDFMQKMTLVP
ncbi:peptidylprolyl isomerase [Flexithrix dorotheae]|uniref:peptidylprolyl isomerase n=1 Tax=Flexithrix dorotheae TaxID=70993 RepID=UPI00036E7CD9|nr:peptidylprolyl isomerase [Flexithrix dorotheae]